MGGLDLNKKLWRIPQRGMVKGVCAGIAQHLDVPVKLVSGALLNFLLAPLFIFVAGLGIFGAGLATAICQTVSFTILTTMSRKFGVMKLSLRNCKPDMLLMREVAGGGLPSLIRQGAGSISVTCVNIAANPFGDAAIAGMAIVMRIMLGANSVIVGLGQGFQPVCGYNYGADRKSVV